MIAGSNFTPDPQGSSKPIPKSVISHRNMRNIQQAFDPSYIDTFIENYPRFFIVYFEEISLPKINPNNLI